MNIDLKYCFVPHTTAEGLEYIYGQWLKWIGQVGEPSNFVWVQQGKITHLGTTY